MSPSSDLTKLSGTPHAQIVQSDPLPRWEQLSPAQQQELVMLLATLLLKQLPAQMVTREGATDD